MYTILCSFMSLIFKLCDTRIFIYVKSMNIVGKSYNIHYLCIQI
nr:MAG TPA: hypothetical protein [Caudoviricetes sp.]